MKTIFFVLFLSLFALTISGQNTSKQKSSASDFSAVTIEGKTVDTTELRGKVIVLNLWYINCPNCIHEIKLLNILVNEYKNNKDVVFLSLATNKKPALEKFLKTNPFAYQIIPDSAQLMLSRFGKPDKNGMLYIGFPLHIVIDKNGNQTVNVEGVKGVEAVKKELKKQFPND